MVEPISTAAAAISLGQAMLSGLDFIRGVTDSSVISAHFNSDGSRIAGSDKIEIERHPGQADDVWWYSVRDLPEYIFVRMPLVDSGFDEILGRVTGEANADARYWR